MKTNTFSEDQIQFFFEAFISSSSKNVSNYCPIHQYLQTIWEDNNLLNSNPAFYLHAPFFCTTNNIFMWKEIHSSLSKQNIYLQYIIIYMDLHFYPTYLNTLSSPNSKFV